MEENLINTLLLKTAFCCMACDDEITLEEVGMIKSICKKTRAQCRGSIVKK